MPLDLFRALRQRPAGQLATKAWRLWREAGSAGVAWRLRLLRAQTQGYARWLQAEAGRAAADCTELDAAIAALPAPPLISVVMPVCDAPEPWLRRAIDSVREQHYPHWQLCIADDASAAPHVRPLLEAAAAAEPRIRLTFRETRGHICAATRSALALADGEFVAFLDHDDELAPLALARVAAEIARYPEADLLYGDEDLIGTDGRRRDPYFKPGWNPDLLRAQNYVCHLAVYRAALLAGLDAFRPEVQGSQDWDLALRAAERARRIRHIPHVLYHWRSLPGSTAHSDIAKDYALEAGRRAVQDHLDRCREAATVEQLPFGHLRVRHALPAPAPRVTLVVAAPAARLEAFLKDAGCENAEVRVAGHDEALPLRLNRAAAGAQGDILCFVDGRARPTEAGWLAILAAEAARPGIGAVGARLLDAAGRVRHAGYLLDAQAVALQPYLGAPAAFAGVRNRALLQQNVTAVSAACLAVRREAFEQAGGFDADCGAFFDVDLCLRLDAAGLYNLWTPHATLLLDAPPAATPDTADLRFMQARWGGRLAQDPAGNPNLELVRGLPVPRIMEA
ncbi:MAG: glycosyltransferase [Betaproteobacteria bacterium]|nr:glycosyltransferase [Betaproteobacteria bacterium]